MSPWLAQQGRVSPQVVIFPLLVLLAVASIVFWYSRRDADDGVLRLSGIVEGDLLELGSKVGGRLESVLVEEGQAVAPGDVMAEFDIPELEARQQQLVALMDEASAGLKRLENGPRQQEIAGARAGVDAARAALDELLAGTRQEDLAQAEAAVREVEARLKLAAADLARAEELYRQDVLARNQLDAAAAAVASLEEQHRAALETYRKAVAGPRAETIEAAAARLDAAQASLDLLRAGSRSEDIEMADARLASAEAQLAGLEAQIAEARVTAASAGTVLTRNFVAGDLVPPGAAVVTLLVGGSYYVQTFIPEGQLSWALPGTKVEIWVDTLPDRPLTGTVEFLAAAGEFTPRNLQTKQDRVEQVFRCKVDVEEAGGLLRPGMACDLVFTAPAGQGE